MNNKTTHEKNVRESGVEDWLLYNPTTKITLYSISKYFSLSKRCKKFNENQIKILKEIKTS